MVLAFRYQDIEGGRDIEGPILRLKLKCISPGDDHKINVYFRVGAGKLSVGDRTVAILHWGKNPGDPESRLTVTGGGEQTLWVHAQLSDAAVEEIVTIARDRIFGASLNVAQIQEVVIPGQTAHALRDHAAELLGERSEDVGGIVNGSENVQLFQVDLSRWQIAVSNTKSGEILVNCVRVFNPEREDLRILIESVKNAEKLRIAGHIPEAVGKIRELVTWAGYKPKGKPNHSRYEKLQEYAIPKKERSYIMQLLDFIWSWVGPSHHLKPGEEDKFSEDQVKVAIDAAYLFLSYISTQKRIASVPP